jgi:signal peptidase I
MSQTPAQPTPPSPATTQAAAGAPPASAATPPALPPKKENIKETIESILVAFILAFVFRAFVVEAFVIPSGSMAPTLMGAHLRMRCQECGYDFQVNFPNDTNNPAALTIPSFTGPVRERDRFGREMPAGRTYDSALAMHCPNCGFKVPKAGVPAEQSALNTPVHYGDRILVLKYLYLLQRPERWDVVVFKTPDTRGSSSPDSWFTQNYIKRLIGLPGEELMLLDGDVYVRNIGETAWRVQTKPRTAQEALWRVVYDNDFYPSQQRRKWANPWQQGAGTGWKAEGRIITFDNAAGPGVLAFNPEANPGTFPLTDWLPYNETRSAGNYPNIGENHYGTEPYGDGRVMRWNVSDLKLRFQYLRKSGDGPLRATMTKLDDKFTAELTKDTARLTRTKPDGSTALIGEAKLPAGDRPVLVELTNADYQVKLRIDDSDVVVSSPQQYAPDVDALLEMHDRRERLRDGGDAIRAVFKRAHVEIVAERQQCELSHVGLWRDVYYTPNYGPGSRIQHGNPGPSPLRLNRKGAGVENEYFVLGDNSILSGDARTWENAVDLRATEDLYAESGRVPERFMLGKAFFVYWPAGFRPFANSPGVVPNFGQMRFIH